MGTEKFNRDFEKRMKEEETQKREGSIKKFLGEQEFQEFTSDGKFFLDKDNIKYGYRGLVVAFKKLDGNVEVTYETCLRDIKPQKDLFQIIHHNTSREFFRLEKDPIYFEENRIPSLQDYNGYFLFGGVSWHISAIDGNYTKTICPVLMLNSHIERKSNP